jgi:hypothetical protein
MIIGIKFWDMNGELRGEWRKGVGWSWIEEDKCMGERSGLWVLLIEGEGEGEGREIRPYCPFWMCPLTGVSLQVA